ncbi:MAG: hypothetical protein H0U57_08085 [Tatlockia sp.]|nr:hypothetical protein [Tatlockia sp.]
MPLYTLKNPKTLKQIITNPELNPPRMELVFEGFSVFSEAKDIIQKIKDLLTLKYIDKELAAILLKEYSDVLDEKKNITTKIIPSTNNEIKNSNKSSKMGLNVSPVYQSLYLSNEEYANRERILNGLPQKKHSSSKKNSIQPSISPIGCTKELQNLQGIQQAIDKSILEDDDRLLMEGILELSIKPLSLIDIAHKEYIDDVNESYFEIGKIKSYQKNSSNTFFASGTSDERLLVNAMNNNVHKTIIDKHQISEIECTFSRDNKGILLTLDCEGLDIDKEQLSISSQEKKNILGCQNVEELIATLVTLKNGKWIAENLKAFIPTGEEFLRHSI